MTLDDRRKKLIFRAWHRGTREMDLLLGTFADAHVPALDEGGLDAFERLLTYQDPDLYDWMCGRGHPGPEDDGPIMRLFLAHRYVA